MHTKTIKQLCDDIKTKKISATELTQHYLKRIEKFNPELNCLISTYSNEALEKAKIVDQRIARGQFAELAGIPIIQKDIFCTQGFRTTCGSKMLDNFVAPYNATNR